MTNGPQRQPIASSPSPSTANPGSFLAGLLGKSVLVRLTTGVDFQGRLLSMDGSMNIALESAIELDPLRVQAELHQLGSVRFDRIFLRGNNVLYIKQN